jgi:hypothetical protein
MRHGLVLLENDSRLIISHAIFFLPLQPGNVGSWRDFGDVVNIEFVASFSPIVEDITSARSFYGEQLGTTSKASRRATPSRNGSTA